MRQSIGMTIMVVGCFCVALARADTVQYELTFDADWSRQTHPYMFPPSPHFSGLIGGTHNDLVHFWSVGAIASDGIERMAETGSKTLLQNEVNSAIDSGTAGSVLSGGGIGVSPGSVRMNFDISSEFPLVSIVSMIAPSPDWFVGVDGLRLLNGEQAEGQWANQVAVPLLPYDSGTDSGPTYTSSNSDTNPAEVIHEITGPPFDGTPPIGTFTFRLTTGDLDASGTHTADDIDLLTDAILSGSTDTTFDLNADGTIDATDRDYWIQRLYGTLAGDANLDRVVDGSDFNLWNSNQGADATWATGDFNGDRLANELDLAILERNLFQPSDPVGAAVPEPPAGGLLLAFLGLTFIRRTVGRSKRKAE